jgi:hypothetical protein
MRRQQCRRPMGGEKAWSVQRDDSNAAANGGWRACAQGGGMPFKGKGANTGTGCACGEEPAAWQWAMHRAARSGLPASGQSAPCAVSA